VRVLLVDDEPAALRRLAMLIEDIDPTRVEIVGEAGNGLEALALARERRPDVILLDIAMREVDGFDVVRHLPAPRPLVIFQTAHHQFALEAFEHDALDYVMKPVTRERLSAALERARARLAQAGARPAIDESTLRTAGAAFGYVAAVPARLLVRFGAGHRLVPLQDILRFSADEGLVCARTATDSPITDYTLNELEVRTGGRFLRVSRSELVNLAHVDRVTSNGDGSLTLTLSNKSTVRVSRRRSADVRQALK
jgi:DNA-binding LytR/AlgR family response regulator